MKKICHWCGRVHDKKFVCDKKPMRDKKDSEQHKFRSKKVWQKKRAQIKRRDNYICQVCIRGLYDTRLKYNYSELSVHHAVPLSEDFEKRLDDDNLITLCEIHHEMAEKNIIPREIILKIIEEQEQNNPPYPI